MARERDQHSGLTRREVLKRGFYGSLAVGLSGSILSNGCAGRRRDKRPNVLLISIDTTRRDHCSAYGYKRQTTPNLRAFAEQGASFDLAYAPTSTTGPSHATFFTSLYPVAHHVVKNGLRLSEEYETIAEILNAQGYQTASVVSSFVLDARFGYAQGFTFYDDDFQPSEATVIAQGKPWEGHRIEGAFDRRADHTTKRAVRWLEEHRNPDYPFFLFVHYFDPHDPYIPPESFVSRFVPDKYFPTSLDKTIGRYDAEIALADQEVGNLLKALERMGLKDDTLVVITSDHGEGLMQHGHLYHGVNIYEETVRVPLIFRWTSRIPQGRLFTAPVGLIHLTPTILDLIGIKPDRWSFQGRSLAASICGQTPLNPERPVYLYRRHYKGENIGKIWVKGEKFGIRLGTLKYIEGQEEETKELFDLSADPQELTNLYTTFPKKAAQLASKLEQWRQKHAGAKPVRGRISEEDLARLRSLGYVE